MDTSIKYSLLDNAKDSLYHAVEHLTRGGKRNSGDLKIAIRDIAHALELILKERLRRAHPAFVWDDVDKYPQLPARTVSTGKAMYRIINIIGVPLHISAQKTILRCRQVRNDIEHYEFAIHTKEAEAIIGRMLSTIFTFAKMHLEVDLEGEFRSDERWSALIKLFEFWKAHSKALEKELSEKDKPYCECPSCGANTFNLEDCQCALCEYQEDQVECHICNNWVWESDTQKYDYLGDNITICNNCIDAERAADMVEDWDK